jgi:hypothetical protein
MKPLDPVFNTSVGAVEPYLGDSTDAWQSIEKRIGALDAETAGFGELWLDEHPRGPFLSDSLILCDQASIQRQHYFGGV